VQIYAPEPDGAQSSLPVKAKESRVTFRSARVGVYLVALVYALSGVSACLAEGSSKDNSEGGYMPDFLAIVREYNASGAPFRIEGTCKSACTIFLGIRNACVERSATLMFHAGHDIKENITGPNTRASRAALNSYNAALRKYLLEGHYMDTDAFHTVPGAVLIDRFGYKECSR
jgi:hypothetical protein